MVAILLSLLLSWIVLRLASENLQTLGLFPTRHRSLQFLAGFTSIGLLAVIYYVIFILVLEAKVVVNGSYSLLGFLKGSWWTLRSVLYEELLFRGALLVLAIKFLGKSKGLFLSSIVFGIYHWFSYNVFGDIPQMINTFMLTGMGGFAFAFAFAETRSLYLPVGLHFGWNLVTTIVFSQGTIGEQLLISTTENTPGEWWSVGSFLYQIILLPLITFFCIKISNRDRRLRGSGLKSINA